MSKLIFISYRRADSLPASRGLAEQLRAIFGFNQVFIDETIDPGQKWPDRIERSLFKSTVVLVVIGPNWLTIADKYGRRRLDAEDDWVRCEIQTAIQSGIATIPVLVGGASLPDDPTALPSSLSSLLDHKWHTLPDEAWDVRIRELIQRLHKEHGFIPNEKEIEFPTRRVDVPILSTEEIDSELRILKGWELVESNIPGDYPNSRSELRKVFKFHDFFQAIQFMNDAVQFIERPNPYPHHPRWENIWKTVTVWLSTWDVKHRISYLDISLAKELDRIYLRSSNRLQESSRKAFEGIQNSRDKYQITEANFDEAIPRKSPLRLPEASRDYLTNRKNIRE